MLHSILTTTCSSEEWKSLMILVFWISWACVLSRFSHVQFFVTLWIIACQDSLSMGFSRQENWSGLPCPPPGDFPDPGIEPVTLSSPALAGGFSSATWGKPWLSQIYSNRCNAVSEMFSQYTCLWEGLTWSRKQTIIKNLIITLGEEENLALFHVCNYKLLYLSYYYLHTPEEKQHSQQHTK